MGRRAAKYLLAGFVLVVLVALATSFSPSVVEAVNPDDSLLRMFPADSDGVLFVDFAAIRDLEFVDRFIRDQVDDQIPGPVEEFSEQTGVDPVNDIQQIIAGGTSPDGLLIIVRVEYDAPRVEEYFADLDVSSEVYSGRTVYALASEDDSLSVVFLEGQVMLGSASAVRASLDRPADGPSVLDNMALMTSIEAIEGGSQVWGVGTSGGGIIDNVVPEGLAPPMATDLIAALETFSYQMRLDAGVTARLSGEFATADTARRAGDLLRGFVAFGKMGMAGQPDLLELLDGLRVENFENSVEINFAATQELLNSISESGDIPFPTD